MKERQANEAEKQELPYSIVEFATHNALLESRPTRAFSLLEFVQASLRSGRVLVQAEPGSGKSHLFASLHMAAQNLNYNIHVEPLRFVSADRRQTWHEEYGAETWIGNRVQRPELPTLICFDDLDEIPPADALRLMDAADLAANRSPQLAFVFADRVVRRPVRYAHWLITGLLHGEPSRTEEPTQAPPMYWRYLPFYARLIKDGQHPTSRSELHEAIMRDALGERFRELDILAKVAAETLELEHNRQIKRRLLYSAVSDEARASLMRCGLIREVSNEVFEFSHQLNHFYLAARWELRELEDPGNTEFKSITIDRANYESLVFLLEQIADEKADSLLRSIDRWSYSASAYVLAEDYWSNRRISSALRSSILLLLGQRRFSGVEATQVAAEDALRFHGGTLATKILACESLEYLIEIAESVTESAPWWSEWQAIFALPSGASASQREIEALKQNDSIFGWTAANVLQRCNLDDNFIKQLTTLAETSTDDFVRWRCVHALAGRPQAVVLKSFLDRLAIDDSRWVKYGALRSYILAAAKLPTTGDRTEAFWQLARLASVILNEDKLQEEVEHSLALPDAPDDWAGSVRALVEELWAGAESTEQRDRWGGLAATLRTDWVDSTVFGVR